MCVELVFSYCLYYALWLWYRYDEISFHALSTGNEYCRERNVFTSFYRYTSIIKKSMANPLVIMVLTSNIGLHAYLMSIWRFNSSHQNQKLANKIVHNNKKQIVIVAQYWCPSVWVYLYLFWVKGRTILIDTINIRHSKWISFGNLVICYF